jgi:hypothetical protein
MAECSAGHPSSHDLAICLAFRTTAEERAALRLRLMAGGWAPTLALAADLRLLPALAMAARDKGLTAGIPAIRQNGQLSVTAALEQALDEHAARSAILRQRLIEILAALARRGIHPLLLKGARSLWTGTPQWRTLRDLDLLVVPPATTLAGEAVLGMGYRPSTEAAGLIGWHHGEELYRDDLPGWIEIHSRAGINRVELVLPTPHLIAAAVAAPGPGGALARILPPAHNILHCLTHHHIGHRGDYSDQIDFKGLYEFAADIETLDEPGRAALLAAAASHPRLMAALDLWLAAAADVFRLDMRTPFRPAPDAQRHWSGMVRRIVERARSKRPPRRFEGLWHEVALTMSPARLRRVAGGGSFIGRLALRGHLVRALTAPFAAGAE